MGVLGIIPARGGSKGVPRKNIRLLCGKPLIAYTIEEARHSERLDYFVVSTDDHEIADVARSCGVDVLMRPAALAQDETPMISVIDDVLARLDPGAERFNILTLLQPTCPFRRGGDIDFSVELLSSSEADAVVGVHRVYDEHPARMYSTDGKWLKSLNPDIAVMNRQDLPIVYKRNGAIYTIRRDVFERDRTFWPKRSVPYIMPTDRSINIDEPLDWLIAESLKKDETIPFPDSELGS